MGWRWRVMRKPLCQRSMQTKAIKLGGLEKEEIAYANGPIFSNDN
jgi:hypothetical protein